MASRKVVERVSARVFCHLEEMGGNPVTIFSSPSALLPATREKLAQGCDWESVMVHHNNRANNDNATPKLSFYMPSGQPVPFCAHAAMGAALEICLSKDDPELDQVRFSVDDDHSPQDDYHTTIYEGDIVALQMKALYEQTPVTPQEPLLFRTLRDYCQVPVQDLASTPRDDLPKLVGEAPILCHASIARPKTLVPLRYLKDLHDMAKAPNHAEAFARSCKALKGTTGLYLYAKSDDEDGAWECRQFPSASGYPEDPATGIAAGALACHLYSHHEMDLPAYKFYQGTAMGKSSLIVVDELTMTEEQEQEQQVEDAEGEQVEEQKQQAEDANERFRKLQASFRLLGRVEIDERDSIEVDDEED